MEIMWPRRIEIDENNWTVKRDECSLNSVELREPIIFINKDQHEIIKGKRNNIKLCPSADKLPCLKSARLVSLYFGYDQSAIYPSGLI